jgi:HSP20 family molecular chaperone IbpA
MRSTNGYLVRDPFRELDSLVRTAFGTSASAPSGFSPAVESHRDGDDAVIRFELPGVDPDKDVTVEVKGRVLVVAGQRHDERSEGRRFSEFRYGSFRRTFRLPPQVTAEAVTASYDAGVLQAEAYGGRETRRGRRPDHSLATQRVLQQVRRRVLAAGVDADHGIDRPPLPPHPGQHRRQPPGPVMADQQRDNARPGGGFHGGSR